MFAEAALSVVRRAGRLAADLAFPPVCLACRKAVADDGGVCAACWGDIRFIERPFCERLGTPFGVELGAEGLVSPAAIADPPAYARARAVVLIDDVATSGATLNAATRALLRGGARRVDVLVFARVVTDG